MPAHRERAAPLHLLDARRVPRQAAHERLGHRARRKACGLGSGVGACGIRGAERSEPEHGSDGDDSARGHVQSLTLARVTSKVGGCRVMVAA